MQEKVVALDQVEIQEQVATPDQVVLKNALKSTKKGVFRSSKKKVSFEPLEESFTNSEKYISCITDKILAGSRSKYHILDTAKLRASTVDERPYRVHGGEVAIYLEAINAGLHFLVHPLFHRVLHSLHVAPIQLNPKVY